MKEMGQGRIGAHDAERRQFKVGEKRRIMLQIRRLLLRYENIHI